MIRPVRVMPREPASRRSRRVSSAAISGAAARAAASLKDASCGVPIGVAARISLAGAWDAAGDWDNPVATGGSGWLSSCIAALIAAHANAPQSYDGLR